MNFRPKCPVGIPSADGLYMIRLAPGNRAFNGWHVARLFTDAAGDRRMAFNLVPEKDEHSSPAASFMGCWGQRVDIVEVAE